MEPIFYIDRTTGKWEEEKVYGAAALKFLYGRGLSSRFFGKPLVYFLARFPFFSAAYGWLQKGSWSKRKVLPFIRAFDVDPSEFAQDPSSYTSFNDFFIRRLKAEARPIADTPAVIPADGRCLFYPNVTAADGFVVKGQKFCLKALLDDEILAKEYEGGAMMIERLCPSDYHRFHFPCSGIPGPSKTINGWLYSVNPAALKHNVHIFTENKRCLTIFETEAFGKVLLLEIGATNVGSIHQTYEQGKPVEKGAEKGYFSFGASALILLFRKDAITFSPDLLTHPHVEVRCLMGQAMGRAS